MPKNPDTFATRLQKLLAKAEMTPYRLAQLCGLPPQTMNRYVNGCREPTFKNVLKIARALGASLSAFDDLEA